MGFNGLGHARHFTVGPGQQQGYYIWWGSTPIPGYGTDQGAQYNAGNPVWEPPEGIGGSVEIVLQGKDVQDYAGGTAVRYYVLLRNSGQYTVWVDFQGGGF